MVAVEENAAAQASAAAAQASAAAALSAPVATVARPASLPSCPPPGRLPSLACTNLWAAVADVVYDLPHETSPLPRAQLAAPSDGSRRARVAFVKTDLLDAFATRVLPGLAEEIVLVTGHSDLSPSALATAAIHASGAVRAWYAVNATFATHKLRPLPLGLAEPDRPHGRQDALAELSAAAHSSGTSIKKIDAVLVTRRAAPSHPLRASLEGFEHPRLARLDACDHPAYARALAAHAFALCPRGNGVDVHRVYEAVLVRTVPVYVSDDPPPAVFAEMPVVVTCSPATLEKTLSTLSYSAFSDADWRASLAQCLTSTHLRELSSVTREAP